MNFADTSKGAQYFTNWYAGPLSTANHRGQNQFIPANLQTLHQPDEERRREPDAAGERTRRAVHRQRPVPAGAEDQAGADRDLGVRQHQRHRLHAGADSPRPRPATIRSSPSSGRTATPTPRCSGPSTATARMLEHSAGVAVRDRGDDAQAPAIWSLDMPPDPGVKPSTNPGVLYTNNGTENSPAVLGTVTVDPQVHQLRRRLLHLPDADPAARHAGHRRQGQTTAFEPGQNLDAYTSFVDTSVMTPDVKRALDDHRRRSATRRPATTIRRPSPTSSTTTPSRTSR